MNYKVQLEQSELLRARLEEEIREHEINLSRANRHLDLLDIKITWLRMKATGEPAHERMQRTGHCYSWCKACKIERAYRDETK